MRNWFLDHPRSVDETYLQHLQAASSFGARMIAGGAACLIHAVLPMVFVKTASIAVSRLHAQMSRRGLPDRPPQVVDTVTALRP